MTRIPFLASASTLAIVLSLAWTPAARADIPPTCDVEASLITCAAADVGKPCQGAGQCFAVPCSAASSGAATTLYKCDACPTVLATSSVTCSTTNLGTACGTGATCMVLSSWCAAGGSKFACAMPPATQPSGPPAGEGSSGGGCAVGAGAGSTAGIAGGLVAIGLVFLSLSRRRRR